MLTTLSQVAGALRTTFTTQADESAARTGFVRRHRKLTGSAFVQTLVFGWLDDPHASIDALTLRLAAQGICLSPQALDQRFTPAATECLREVVQHALQALVAARPGSVPLLSRFAGVYVDDTTVVALPGQLEPQWPGCGGTEATHGQAAIKLAVRWELRTGRLTNLAFHPGRVPDVKAGVFAEPLPPGSLRLADMGYFDLARLRDDSQRGVFWISRLPPHVLISVGDEIPYAAADLLTRSQANRLDIPVAIGGGEPLACRFLAFRCPPEVARQRRERLLRRLRNKGRPVTPRLLKLCEWTVFVTNLSPVAFSAEQIWVLYRVRWQIELLFKLWKSHGGLGHSRGRSGDRVLCELYAKLLAMLVHHWIRLLAGGPMTTMSPVRVARHVRRCIACIVESLASPRKLRQMLRRVLRQLKKLRPRKPRKKRPSTLELLQNPEKCGLS